MERYWAVKAGVGFIGRNAQLIVPGHGSACFLGEIVTTIPLPASTPSGACPDGCDFVHTGMSRTGYIPRMHC